MGDEEKQTKAYLLTEKQYKEFLGKRYESLPFEEAGGRADILDENRKKIGTATRNPFTGDITVATDNDKAQKYLEGKGIEGKRTETIEETARRIFEGIFKDMGPEDRARFSRDGVDFIRRKSPEDVYRLMEEPPKQAKPSSLTQEQYKEFLGANKYESFSFEEAGGRVDIRDENGKKIGTAIRHPFTLKITIETDDDKARKYLEEKGIEVKRVGTMEESVRRVFEGMSPENRARFKDGMDVIRRMSPIARDEFITKLAKSFEKKKQKG